MSMMMDDDREQFLLEDCGFFSDQSSEATISSGRQSPEPRLRVERSISVHSALKKASCSDRQRKAVHFADTMGLDLVSIRPLFPHSYSRLDLDDDIFANSPPAFVFRPEFNSYGSGISVTPRVVSRKSGVCVQPRYLHPLFDCGSCHDTAKSKAIADATRREGVRLKYSSVMGMTITGVISVSNIAYEKQVHVRYTLDGWASSVDVPALYISSSSLDKVDTFSFSLFLPQQLPIGSRCEFCIRYQTGNGQQTFWDNNNRLNYTVECKALSNRQDESDEDEGIGSGTPIFY